MNAPIGSASVDPLRLDGRVAIVTGAGHGLGRAHALELARRGARVLVNNRRRATDPEGESSAGQTAAAIRSAGGEAQANWEDVLDPQSGLRLVAHALEAWGRLDILVCNAGVSQHVPFHRIPADEFRRVFDVNFYGSLYVTHAAYAHMHATGYGRIVLSTSSAGLHGLHGLTAYSASKAALIGLTRSLAQEGARCGVRVNAVSPYAHTNMTAQHMPADLAARLRAEYVAPLVAYFASEGCALNGEVVVAGKGAFRRAATAEGPLLRYTRADELTVERLHADIGHFAARAPIEEFTDARAAFARFHLSTAGVQ